MNRWLNSHLQTLKQVVARWRQHLFSNLLISLTIAVTLALPVIVYLVLTSFSHLTSTIQSDSHISVFLSSSATPTTIDSIHNILTTKEMIAQFHFVPKAEALKQLMMDSNNSNIISTLPENPLPDAFFIEPKSLASEAIKQLKNELAQLDGVEAVQVDDAWLKRLSYLLTLGQKALLVLASLLGFALFMVIGNTIRMQILTQQEEIEVSQLIGATHRFIRRPFLYAGAIYGFVGALFALIISTAVIALFNLSISALATAYQSDFSLRLPSLEVTLITCLTAIGIGLFSAYFAVAKSLFKSIQ